MSLISKGTKGEEMVFDHEGGNGFDFYSAYCSVKLKFLSKKSPVY